MKDMPEIKPVDNTPEGWYKTWSENRNPETGSKLLGALEPSMKAAARKWAGDDSPTVMGQAKKLIITALPRYDASRSSMATFVDRQLQPLTRWKSRKNIGVRVPTSAVQDVRRVALVEEELEDELGRAPSHEEIADKSGISLERLTKVSRMKYPVLAEAQQENGDGGKSFVEDQSVKGEEDLWQKTVYHSLTPVDQVIMQHTIGLYGANQLSNQAIAKKLRITPGAVTQRKSRIQKLLDSTPVEMQ